MIAKLISKAISFLGVKEPTGDDQFIQYYNNITKAGFSLSVAWCAIYLTVIARMVGVKTSVIPNFASCDLGKKWFSDKGRYEKSLAFGGAYTPKVGDIVFYSSKYAQNDSTHVGYVVEVDGENLKAIEGNKSDAVGYRTIALSNKYIIGYGRVADFVTEVSDVNSTSDAEKIIWNFLTGKGLNAYAVAGLMGNLYAESGLRANNLQNSGENKLNMTDAEYTTAVDNGSYGKFVKDSIGYGLAQWTYWTRKQNLHNFAKNAGKSIGDLGMQLEFLWNELQGYKAVIKVLKNATSILQASNAVLTGYEKPANQSDSVKKKRASYGQAYFDKYADDVLEEDKSSVKDSKICTVREFQKWLNYNFGTALKEDNSYGPKTKKAAVEAWQKTVNKSFGGKLVVDGDFGPLSKNHGNKASVKRGSKGTFVYILEGVLCAKGFYAGELDGICGSICVNGIKEFQKSKGLTVDGKCGANTWFALLN